MHTLFSFCNTFASNDPFLVFLDALNARQRPLYSAQKFIEKFGLSEKLRPHNYLSTLTIEQLSQVEVSHKKIHLEPEVSLNVGDTEQPGK